MRDETLRAIFKSLTDHERALFEERAAVMEFEGNATREIANREALWDVIRQRKHNLQ